MIIWEFINTNMRFKWKGLLVIFLLFGIFFVAYVSIERWALEINYMRDPPGIVCENVLSDNFEQNRILATMEFDQKFYDTYQKWNFIRPSNLLNENMSNRVSKKGYLSCFCKQ